MIQVVSAMAPPWIEALADAVAEAISPTDFMGPLGYSFWDPETPGNDPTCWHIALYPTPHTFTGGPHDGAKAITGFVFNIQAFSKIFTDISALDWCAPAKYNGNLDGHALRIRGNFLGKDVQISLFQMPPDDEPASCCYNPQTGEYVPLTSL